MITRSLDPSPEMPFRWQCPCGASGRTSLNIIVCPDCRDASYSGRSCLVCREFTASEGQLCTACVAKGHRVENHQVLLAVDIVWPA